jgi:hypothetical protein
MSDSESREDDETEYTQRYSTSIKNYPKLRIHIPKKINQASMVNSILPAEAFHRVRNGSEIALLWPIFTSEIS